jgi:hypothetical protein
MKFICVGYPDEENRYHGHHTSVEEWECEADNEDEAYNLACRHFCYFHEIGVYEK